MSHPLEPIWWHLKGRGRLDAEFNLDSTLVDSLRVSSMNLPAKAGLLTLFVVAIAAAQATMSKEPVKWSAVDPFPVQSIYYPGTERLRPNEMRVVACGTGMPQPRLKQAGSCYLVELGNGASSLRPRRRFPVILVGQRGQCGPPTAVSLGAGWWAEPCLGY
jgi:hypothetical protein